LLSKRILEYVSGNKLFEGIDPGMLVHLDEKLFRERTCPIGEVILEQGSVAKEIVLIVSGEVSITKKMTGDREVFITKRKNNEFIGEMSLIGDEARSATANCTLMTKLLIINKNDFFSICDLFPKLRDNLAKTIAVRLRESDERRTSEISKYTKLFELHQKINSQKKELERLNEKLALQNMKLIKAQEEIILLEQKNAIMAMAVTVNHEINQPLSILKGFFHLLKQTLDENSLTEKQRDIFKKTDAAFERIHVILKKYSSSKSTHFAEYCGDVKMVIFEEGRDRK